MKKTSLVLAISALLYGTSGTYALADVTLSPEMSPEKVSAFLDTIVFPAEEEVIPENAPDSGDVIAGLDPAQPLDPNVSIINNTAVYKPAMCNPNSFPVNGDEMKGILVTVEGTITESVRWTTPPPTNNPPGGSSAGLGYALGTGWVLAERGDTWNHQWMLYTDEGVSITKIVIHALNVYPAKGRVYAFDVGGKQPRAPLPAVPQHTPDSARGQFIKQTVPTPPPRIFTATYTDPVYTNAHGPADGTDIPLTPTYGGPAAQPASRVPKHDLYGTLTIDFLSPPSPVGGATPIDVIDFAYIADTDCLPVQQVDNISYVGTTLNFTVVGEGAVAIMENAQKLVQGPFMVERGQGQATFTTQFIPTAGSCYSMMDVDTLKVMTKDYCF